MQHVDSIDALTLTGCELTIGSFDGIHVGHRQLVKQMLSAAHRAGLPTTVLSFFPHPSVVLRGRKPAFYLSSPEDKARLLGELGVDYVINQRFDIQLSRLRAADFLDWIGARLHPRGLWVGPDFALGYRREGDIAYLRSVAGARGFELNVVEPSMVGGEVVSSTRIRRALWAGEVAQAGRLLGAPFSLPGGTPDFGAGARDGRPSMARLQIAEERACPRQGLYAGQLQSGLDQQPVLIHVLHAPAPDLDPQPSEIELYLPQSTGWSSADSRLAFLERLGESPSARLSTDEIQAFLRVAAHAKGPDRSG